MCCILEVGVAGALNQWSEHLLSCVEVLPLPHFCYLAYMHGFIMWVWFGENGQRIDLQRIDLERGLKRE